MNLIKYDKQLITPPVGLRNINVLCYLNSLIQALMSCSSVNMYFLKNEQIHIINKNTVAIEYTRLLKRSIISNPHNVLDPSPLFNVFISKVNEINPSGSFGKGQEDTGEMLHLFLETINDDELYRLFMHRYMSTVWCINCKKQLVKGTDKSMVIEIPNSYNPLNENSFNEHIRQNNAPHKHICKYCKYEKCYSTYQLTYAPEVIIVMFHKSNYKKKIDFPEKLIFQSSNSNIIKYEITAKIEHYGNKNSGHYTAHSYRYHKNSEGIYKFDDEISKMEGSFKPTANTYFVFYNYKE
jgi:ubiquitin C-terminal hydrolase